MANDKRPSYDELEKRLQNAEGALKALRAGQVDTIAGEAGHLVVRLAEAEAKAAHIKQVLLAIRTVNQIIMVEDDPEQLIGKACSRLTETMAYGTVWIVLFKDPEQKEIFTAFSGFKDSVPTLRDNLSRGLFPACTLRALAEDGLVMIRDPKAMCPPCPLSVEYDGRAVFSRRLFYNDNIHGVITASVPIAYANDEEERSLFDEISCDIAFALHKIAAAEYLRRREEMLARTERIAQVGSWEWDIAHEQVFWSQELFRIFKRDPKKGAPSYADHPNLYMPEDMERLSRAVDRCVKEGAPYEIELRAIREDGVIRHTIARGEAERSPEGKIDRLVGSLQDITDRKMVQNRIALLGRMLDIAPAAITIHDTKGRFLYANQAACQIHGYEEEAEFLSISLQELDAPESAAMIGHHLDAIARDGSAHFEVSHYRKDGSSFPLEVFAGAIEWEGTLAVLSVATDITDRKAAEALIREQQHELALTLEATTEGLWEWDFRKSRMKFSPGYYRMLGYQPNEFPSDYENWKSRLHPDDVMHALSVADAYLKTKPDRYQNEFRMRTKEGAYRFIISRGKVVARDDQGEALRMIGSHQDITALKEMELSLRESEERFRQIYEHMAVGVARVDLGFRIEQANAAYCLMLGYTEQELLGKHLKEITHPETLPENLRLQNELAQGKVDHYRMEKSFIHKNGRMIHGILDACLVKDAKGKPKYFLGCVVDITERKHLAEQLHQSRKMESIGRLAGGVAHDYNNMLSVILGSTELAMEKTVPGDPVTEYLKEIQLAAGRSADITRQLLAFARKQTIQPRFLDLNEALEAMLKMLRRLINEDVNLRWFPHPSLPWVNMDPSQISQILMNLCMNAKDAMSEGGTITIETRPVTLSPSDFWGQQEEMDPGEYVLLMVSDTGHGMDKETLELLFEPFFSTKSIGKGTGLGLSTVYGIVKQNRGRITVYSEPGIGTTFRIYLPACQKKDLRERRETGPLDKSPAPSAATILVVEDEPSILKLTKQILERIGYTVLTAESPKRAIEAAINHPFEIHLLITDVVMPGMNGRELAKKLLTLHPTIKCLFMSGYTANVIAHHGVIDDGVHFIQKPFTRQELAVTVLKALGRSE